MAEKQRKKELRNEAKAEYKERIRQVKELNRNEDPLKIQEFIEENFVRGDELYSRIKRKLDGTVVDAKHMRELVNLAQESSKRINTSSSHFDLKKIITVLKRNEENEEGKQLSVKEFVNFVGNQHVKQFILIPPTFEFFYGALKSEDLQIREKKKRSPREKLITTQAVTAKEKNMEIDVEEDSTPKEVEHINEQINLKVKNKPEGVPFFATLVDPNSFTLTVENIFHTSFLIKEGRIGVKRDHSKRPVLFIDPDCNSERPREVEQPTIKEGNQSILSFSMEDYKNWISTFNIRRRSFAPRSDHHENDN